MAGTLTVQNIEGPSSGSDANKVIIPSGQTLYAPGHVLQVVQTYKIDAFTMSTSTTETDITGLSATITPTSTSSKILVMSTVHWSSAATSNAVLVMKRSGTTIGNSTSGSTRNSFSMANQGATDDRLVMPSNIMIMDSPATTSATTYKITVWTDNSSLFTVNRRAINSDYGMSSHITLMEIAQ